MLKQCGFETFFMYSQSIDVDSSWIRGTITQKQNMKVQHTDEEVIYVEQHEPEAFHEILGAHHKHDLLILQTI